MISTNLQGGLGNNLFQIAACIGHAANLGSDWKFNYCIPDWRYSEQFNKLNIEKCYPLPYPESVFEYQKIPLIDGICLDGYWQSEKYFKHIESDIRDIFAPNEEIENYIDGVYGEVLIENTCAIHIRRGDYLNLSEYHNNLSLDYYKEAMSLMKHKTFIIFSDDIAWCKENIKAHEYISNGAGEREYGDLVDFFTMAKCKSHIIANSSFSWWASWLSGSTEIIAPKNWFGPKKANLDTSDLYTDKMVLI